MSIQTPHYQSEEDMVLVSGTDYVRMSNIGGGSVSIKLPTTGPNTLFTETISGEIIAVNGGTYVDQGRLGVVAIRQSGANGDIALPGYVMMYDPDSTPEEMSYSRNIPDSIASLTTQLTTAQNTITTLQTEISTLKTINQDILARLSNAESLLLSHSHP